MGIWLEDKIRDAVLDVRWRRAGDSCHPDYFVGSEPSSLQTEPSSLQMEGSAASFLARFIAARVIACQDGAQNKSVRKELETYSLDDLANYLEDQGYVVTSP